MENKREHFKISKVTGKKYNVFGVVRILNIYQARAYIRNGAELLHLEFSEDRKTGNPIIVFLFDREKTADLYDLWCKHRLN